MQTLWLRSIAFSKRQSLIHSGLSLWQLCCVRSPTASTRMRIRFEKHLATPAAADAPRTARGRM
jgi:hypothetical protein